MLACHPRHGESKAERIATDSPITTLALRTLQIEHTTDATQVRSPSFSINELLAEHFVNAIQAKELRFFGLTQFMIDGFSLAAIPNLLTTSFRFSCRASTGHYTLACLAIFTFQRNRQLLPSSAIDPAASALPLVSNLAA
jgi:hypothetical protein